MRENPLPLKYSSAEETANSVQITLAHFAAAAGSASAPSDAAVAPQSVAYVPEQYTKVEEERDPKLEKWLLAAGALSVTVLFTSLYSIRNREFIPNVIDRTVKISQYLVKSASAPFFGKSVNDTAKAGAETVQTKVPTALASNKVGSAPFDNSPASTRNDKSNSSSHKLASDNRAAKRSAGNSGSAGGKLPVTEVPKFAGAITSKTKDGYLVPPPPPTPFVLPPTFGFFSTMPGQQQTQVSPKTHHQASTADSGKTDASESAALGAADQEMQDALNSSSLHKNEWTR